MFDGSSTPESPPLSSEDKLKMVGEALNSDQSMLKNTAPQIPRRGILAGLLGLFGLVGFSSPDKTNATSQAVDTAAELNKEGHPQPPAAETQTEVK